MVSFSNKMLKRQAGPKPVTPSSMRTTSISLLQKLDRGGMAIYHFPKQRLSRRHCDIRKGKKRSSDDSEPEGTDEPRASTEDADGSEALTTFIEDNITPHPYLENDTPNAAILTYVMPENVALHAGPETLANWAKHQGNELAARHVAKSDSSDAQFADTESSDDVWTSRANGGRSCCTDDNSALMPPANTLTGYGADGEVAIESDDELGTSNWAAYDSRVGVEAWLGIRDPLEVVYTVGEHIEEVESSTVTRNKRIATSMTFDDNRKESLKEKIRRWSWPLRYKSRFEHAARSVEQNPERVTAPRS